MTTAVLDAPDQSVAPDTQAADTNLTPDPNGRDSQNNTSADDGNNSQSSQQDTGLPEGVTDKQEWLETLIERDSDPQNEFTDAELDLMEDYYAGKLKPRSADKKEDASKAKYDKAADDKTDDGGKKPEDKSDTDDDDGFDEDTIKDNSSLDLAIMKEVGAKNKSEVPEKIKGLRKAISGKLDADPGYQQVTDELQTVKTQVQNEQRFWQDLSQGKPEAIEHLAKRGFEITAINGQKPTQATSGKTPDASDPFHIDPDKFVDEEMAGALNYTLSTVKQKLEALEAENAKYRESLDKQKQDVQSQKVEAGIIDEMVQVAAHIPQLKGVENLRDALTAWHKGNNDPRMNYFADLFELATEKNVDLVTALEIDRGRKAALAVKQAKEDGRKEAYTRKPNKSLSDIQGKAVNQPNDFSEAEIKSMIENEDIPEEWYDENDNPNPNVIPEKAWKYFWPNGKPF